MHISGAKFEEHCSNISGDIDDSYILLDVLVCSIAVYFYELCGILTSP